VTKHLKELTKDGNIKEEYESTRDYMQDYVHHEEVMLTTKGNTKKNEKVETMPDYTEGGTLKLRELTSFMFPSFVSSFKCLVTVSSSIYLNFLSALMNLL